MVFYRLSEIIIKQPTINIGCIGHVSHGKSTLVKSLSGTSTLRYAKEKKKNSTIHLGYANMQIYKSRDTGEVYIKNNENYERTKTDILTKHISFVDCPGHQSYIANMLNGSSVMDFAFLVVDSTDKNVLQVQAYEHLFALLVGGMENIVCIQNKIDLMSQDECKDNKILIEKALKDEFDLEIDIIPVSSQLGYNVDILKYFITQIPEKISSKVNGNLLIPIIRSFDINKPGDDSRNLKGGVIGGSIIRGNCQKGDLVEIRPGLYNSKDNVCFPIVAKVESIFTETTEMDIAFPGGLIAVGLNIDPFFAKTDQLIGHNLGFYKGLPEVYHTITIKYRSLQRNKGRFKKDENIKVHSLSYCDFGKVLNVDKENKKVTIQLNKPICLENGQRLALFRKFEERYMLTHAGLFENGEEVNVEYEDDFEKLGLVHKNREIQIENDLNISDSKIELDYNDLIEICNKEKRENMLNLVYPTTIYQNKYTTLHNFRDIVKCLTNETKNSEDVIEDKLIKHIKKEMAEFYSYDNDSRVLFNKKIKPTNVLDCIVSFSEEYLRCKSCKQFVTEVTREDRLTWVFCHECKGKHHIL